MIRSFDSYDLIFENRANYLYVLIRSSEAKREMVDDYIREIVNECLAQSCDRLLIEKRVPNTNWLGDLLSIFGQFPLFNLGNVRVALIDGSCDHFHGNGFEVELGKEPVMDLRVFTNPAEGETWLAA